jgi:hypothetical protein
VCRGNIQLVWFAYVWKEQTVGMVCWSLEGTDSWYIVLGWREQTIV